MEALNNDRSVFCSESQISRNALKFIHRIILKDTMAPCGSDGQVDKTWKGSD